MSLLIADRLCRVVSPTLAITEISLHLEPGEILALIGPSGAGKSAILDMIGGQTHPDRGHLRLGGDDIGRSDPRAISRLGVGRTFQQPATFGSMTVRENVQIAMLSARDQLARWWRPARRYHRSRADLLLQRVGLLDHADRAAAALAPGCLRRLDLALALAHRPRLLLLDEPTADLPPADALLLKSVIHDLAIRDGCAILWAETDIDAVLGVADRILTLGPHAAPASLPLQEPND